MPRKAVIMISLTEESIERAKEEIEREILEELSKHPPKIPWMKAVLAVRVTEE